MKIYKDKYGKWETTAYSKDRDENQIKAYQDVSFRKTEEPTEEGMEGKLIFERSDGQKYDCFFSSYVTKAGIVKTKLVMLLQNKPALKEPESKPVWNRPRIDITQDDLPFDYDEKEKKDEAVPW